MCTSKLPISGQLVWAEFAWVGLMERLDCKFCSGQNPALPPPSTSCLKKCILLPKPLHKVSLVHGCKVQGRSLNPTTVPNPDKIDCQTPSILVILGTCTLSSQAKSTIETLNPKPFEGLSSDQPLNQKPNP